MDEKVMDKRPASEKRRMRPAMHSCAGWAPLLPPRGVDDAVVGAARTIAVIPAEAVIQTSGVPGFRRSQPKEVQSPE